MDEREAPLAGDARASHADHASASAAGRRARGRANILAGQVAPEAPLHDGGRWGIGAVFRPAGPALSLLAGVAASTVAVAGSDHWVHGTDELHLTIRTFEPHRSVVPHGDPRLVRYANALDQAAAGMPAGRIRFRGLSPHPAGIAVGAYPCDPTADRLRARLAAAIDERGGDAGVEARQRTGWYVNLVHFAGTVADPRRLVAWCDERQDLVLGEAPLPHAEIVSWSWTGANVRMHSRHAVTLGGVRRVTSQVVDDGR